MRPFLALLLALPLAAATFDPLPPVDFSKVKPADFSDDELDLPFYLAHFREVADGVVAEGPDRGFINISVWRPQSGNKPYNARIMENILSLAYFYTTRRPWNPYYGSPALRQRLEASLDFWCRIQSPDGQFSEYGPKQWNLAATAFATKFVGRALVLLHDGPPVDAALLKRVEDADRKTIHAVLTDAELWRHGLSYSNQYTNVWAGGLEFFHILPDAPLEDLFWTKVAEGLSRFQSPAGFFYEADGPDFGYNSDTSQHNLEVVYNWTHNTPRAGQFVEHDRRWFEWLSWNAVPAVDGTGWVLNRAIETRQKHAFFEQLTTPLAEHIPTARAYAVSWEERAAEIRRTRAELEKNWPNFPPLKVGDFWSYSPYAFLHRDQYHWYPTAREQAEARAKLPFAASEKFVHQLQDSRNPEIFTYIRQPAYYAAFNSGKQVTKQQRYGLGLLWTPSDGAVLQSQTASDTAAWGTKTEGHAGVWENGDLDATFSDGNLSVRYAIGTGEKTIRFEPDRIVVTVHSPGAFTEIVPLLGEVRAAADGASGTGISVQYGASAHATLDQTETSVGKKRLVVLRLAAENELTYTLVPGRGSK
jgi:hypothetical protein